MFSSKHLIWTIAFGICFLIFEWVVLPNSLVDLDVWVKHIKHGSYFRLLIVLGLSTFALVLFLAFIYAALASSRVYQVIYFSVFSFLVATEYGYYNAIGQFFEIHEMEVALLATNAEIIANAATIYFNYLALVPILGFGVLLLIAPRVIERGFIPLSAIILSLGLFFFATTYLTKNTFYVHSFNHAIRTIVTLPVIWYLGTSNYTPKSFHYYTARATVDRVSQSQPENNIVFIVDESVRSDHLSLNGYAKPTARILEKLNEQGYIKNWGTAVAGTTCSTTSNALMLTGLNDLPDIDYKVFKMPTIFQYAKAMNYKTHYFDGQLSKLWNGKPSDRFDLGSWTSAADLQKTFNTDIKTTLKLPVASRRSLILQPETLFGSASSAFTNPIRVRTLQLILVFQRISLLPSMRRVSTKRI